MICIIKKYGSMDWSKERPWYLCKGKRFTCQANWARPLREAKMLTEDEVEYIMHLNRKLPQTQRASVLKFETERELFKEILRSKNG